MMMNPNLNPQEDVDGHPGRYIRHEHYVLSHDRCSRHPPGTTGCERVFRLMMRVRVESGVGLGLELESSPFEMISAQNFLVIAA